jgi:PIN domain nuclease of toxin-antitoxin system
MARSVLADTHAVVWYLSKSEKLSRAAFSAIDEALQTAAPVFVSTISLVEIIYLIERQRLVAETFTRLMAEVRDPTSSVVLASLDRNVALALQRIPRGEVADMPDRVIAATALALSVPIVTRDEAIRKSSVVETIW